MRYCWRTAALVSLIVVSIYGSITLSDYRRQDVTENNSDNNRSKRYLAFTRGGSWKIVVGFVAGVPLPFKRNMVCTYNFQAQYSVPEKFTTFSQLQSRSSKSEHMKQINTLTGPQGDDSRKYVYYGIELFLDRLGRNGRECLLRTICETAQSSLAHNGLFGEILEVVFSPGTETIDQEYRDARDAGRAGVDCIHSYRKCPKGNSVLDKIMS